MAVLFACFASAFAVRTAWVADFAADDPSRAAELWARHPSIIASKSMIAVGSAARNLQQPPAPVMRDLRELSALSPLSPEPFLVNGAIAEREGRFGQATSLFVAAERRDPRSVAARYLLADVYTRENRIEAALDQLAVLVRLNSSFSGALAPSLARYAQQPGAVPHLRELLRKSPSIRSVLLSELAADPANTRLVLSLATSAPSIDAKEPWQQKLVNTLVKADDFAAAYRVANRVSGAEGQKQSGFRDEVPFAPFSWTFAHSAAADAQRSGDRLHIFFSGEDNVTFAARTTVLPPGRYRVTAGAKGSVPEAVQWVGSCLPGNSDLLDLPLTHTKVAAVVRIAPECRAQHWQLVGASETVPAAASFVLTSFDITPVAK